MSPSSRPLALALLVCVLVVSGCGGSSSSTALTRSELIARADAICRRINARLASSTISKPQDYVRILPPLAEYEHAAVAQLRKLVPPASMADGWRQIVTGAQTLADATAKLGEDAKTSLQATPSVRSASIAAATGTRQMTSAAVKEGLKDCARTP